MTRDAEGQLAQSIWEQLRENFRVAGKTLFTLRQKLSLPENGIYVIEQTLGDNIGNIARIPIVCELRSNEAFRSLVNFVNSQPALQIVFLKSSEQDFAELERLKDSCRLAVELILLRIVVSLEMEASTSRDLETVGKLLDDLIAFLRSSKVKRKVCVPLYNIGIVSDEVAVEGVGKLRRTVPGPNEFDGLIRNLSVCPVNLEFEVETDHFFAAHLFPISQEIGKRVAILRLFYQPLISFNHFSIESVRPWESPLRDSDFSSRFWADQIKRPEIPSELIGEDPAPLQASAISQIENFEWNSSTPWKLAINRLDDSIFKLNSNSPDTILDLAIGLECIFTESESRQESVHKVAVRAARYLENTEHGRREVFRQVKQIYRARSTLAHGKAWKLDSPGLKQIEIAARLLAAALRLMIVQGVSELDLEKLDLG
jgi:Apea-like HEPN